MYGWFGAVFDKKPSFKELKAEGYVIQFISPRAIAHPCQIIWGLYHALREIKRGSSRAKDRGLEALLWITGSWQIKEALERGGIKEDEREAFVLFFGSGVSEKDIDLTVSCSPTPPPKVVLEVLKRSSGRISEVKPRGKEAFYYLSKREVKEEEVLAEVLEWVTLKGGKLL